MRFWRKLTILLAISLVFLGCSDDGDGGNGGASGGGASSGTLDLSGAADTPFCQAMAESLEALAEALKNPSAEFPPEMRANAAEMVQEAPPEIRADVEAGIGRASDIPSFAEFFEQPESVLEANQRVAEYVNDNCNIDMNAVDEYFQQ